MKNKKMGNIFYGIIVLLLLIAVIFIVINKNTKNTNTMIKNNIPVKNIDASLNKYRQAPIPENCRLADYDNDVKGWAEHLSHHENTRYCLEYYEGLY